MALVKGELGQQNGSASKLVEIPQKADRPVADHEKDIQIIFIMREVHQILFPGAEIILPFLEGMPHDAVPAGGPVKGSGGSHSAIRPAVLVFYGNDLSLVGKTAVLYAAAVKIFVRLRLQGKAGFALSKKDGGRLLHHHGMILQIDHLEKRGLFIYLNPDLPRSDDNRIALLVHIQPGNRPPGTVRQNAGFRFRLGISDNTASVIPENPENIVSVKIERHPAVVVKQHFHGGRIDFSGAFNGLGLLLRNRFFRCGKREAEKEMDNPKASRTDFRNMPWSIEFPIIVVFYIIQRNGVAGRMQTVVSWRAADRFHSSCRPISRLSCRTIPFVRNRNKAKDGSNGTQSLHTFIKYLFIKGCLSRMTLFLLHGRKP